MISRHEARLELPAFNDALAVGALAKGIWTREYEARGREPLAAASIRNCSTPSLVMLFELCSRLASTCWLVLSAVAALKQPLLWSRFEQSRHVLFYARSSRIPLSHSEIADLKPVPSSILQPQFRIFFPRRAFVHSDLSC